MALVDAVEALKDPALVLGRNADAGIEDRDGGFLLAVFNVNADASAGAVVFDGIVAEIVEHLVQEPAYAEDDAALAVGRDGDRGLVCRRAKILGDLGLVLLAAYIGYIIHVVLVYSLSVKVFAKMSPIKFFKGVLPAAVFAFTSTSSVASLPVSKECCDEMGVENDISSFVLPLGATINMDGTAIYQCVAAIFLAKCIGVDLTMGQMVTIVVTATLASIGTAGTSGAGMIMLAMVLDAVGIDPTYIGLIYGVDRLFDMGRTSLNVIGDASCAICVNYWEGNAKKAAAKKA